ncbi:GtrA family protein [Succinivibrio dextrinosolvens]|uniref:GtrA family protein n=1 Tax=Succinivibrio dextrinosolvens TaxID=83771 RepID=UPI001923AA75
MIIKKIKDKKTKKQIVKFTIIGGIAFVIDYFLLIFFTEILHQNYLIANFFSYSISTIFNYIFTIKWVFTNKRNKIKDVRLFTIFNILCIVGLLINQIIIYTFTDLLGWYYLISKLFATFIVLVFNFITRKMLLDK